MNKRSVIKGELHHWWPRSLSQFWTDENGLIGRIDASGSISNSNPKNTARISDGHNIRFDGSSWDTTFEQDFDRPDSQFPDVVDWLNSLAENHPVNARPQVDGIHHAHECGRDDLETLSECLVSLAIRSPRHRNSVLRTIESVRNQVPKEEHKRLIAANLLQASSFAASDMLSHGKFVLLISSSDEFIFGDGFYNNLSFNTPNMIDEQLLMPITPKLAILWALPIEYLQEPRLVSRKIDNEIVALINETVQVSSKDYLFFRGEPPILSDHFLKREHQTYTEGDPVDDLVAEIPGVVSSPQWTYRNFGIPTK